MTSLFHFIFVSLDILVSNLPCIRTLSPVLLCLPTMLQTLFILQICSVYIWNCFELYAFTMVYLSFVQSNKPADTNAVFNTCHLTLACVIDWSHFSFSPIQNINPHKSSCIFDCGLMVNDISKNLERLEFISISFIYCL